MIHHHYSGVEHLHGDRDEDLESEDFVCPVCGFLSDNRGACPICEYALTCHEMVYRNSSLTA